MPAHPHVARGGYHLPIVEAPDGGGHGGGRVKSPESCACRRKVVSRACLRPTIRDGPTSLGREGAVGAARLRRDLGRDLWAGKVVGTPVGAHRRRLGSSLPAEQDG